MLCLLIDMITRAILWYMTGEVQQPMGNPLGSDYRRMDQNDKCNRQFDDYMRRQNEAMNKTRRDNDRYMRRRYG